MLKLYTKKQKNKEHHNSASNTERWYWGCDCIGIPKALGFLDLRFCSIGSIDSEPSSCSENNPMLATASTPANPSIATLNVSPSI